MSCKRRAFVLFLIGLLLLKEPAWILAQPTPVASPNAVVPGLVIIVEGIGGIDLIGKSADHCCQACRPASRHPSFHLDAWNRPVPQGSARHAAHPQESRRTRGIHQGLSRKNPNRPIYIVAKSGGTGLVLYALQGVPANTVERVILLSAAVSPTYDLRPALRRPGAN